MIVLAILAAFGFGFMAAAPTYRSAFKAYRTRREDRERNLLKEIAILRGR